MAFFSKKIKSKKHTTNRRHGDEIHSLEGQKVSRLGWLPPGASGFFEGKYVQEGPLTHSPNTLGAPKRLGFNPWTRKKKPALSLG